MMIALRSLVPLVLALLATGAAGWTLHREMTRVPQEWQAVVRRQAAEDADRLTALPAQPLPPIARFTAVRDKPLFSPLRRPSGATVEEVAVPEDAPRSAPAPARPLRATLRGIVGVGEARKAILQAGPGGPVYIAPGEELDGWTLVDIHPDAVDFARDGRTTTLTLSYKP